ncbi:MAG: type II toxin-antitoxin system RatA family toxin [Verrucomicrobiales bacterium]
MQQANSIIINASREKIFALTSDLNNWLELLPHYRSIEFLGEQNGHHLVKMAAVRSGIPISWVSEQWAEPDNFEIHFLHLKAWTKGMKVVWTMAPVAEGGVRVEIHHDLKFRVPALSPALEPIIGGFFIHYIANQTLRCFKEHLETFA